MVGPAGPGAANVISEKQAPGPCLFCLTRHGVALKGSPFFFLIKGLLFNTARIN